MASLNFVLCRMSLFEKGDWKGVVDLFTNARQVVSSIQDVAQKLAEYAKSRGQTTYSGSSFAHSAYSVTTLRIHIEHGELFLLLPMIFYSY